MDEPTTRQVLAVQGYMELGLFAEAGEDLDAIDQDLDVVKMLRCEFFSRQSMWQEMSELAEQLSHASPGNSQWWISWAYAVRRLDSVDAARAILVEARKSHPKEPIIVYNLACYASVSENFEEARSLLDQAIDLDGNCREMAVKDADLKPLFKS